MASALLDQPSPKSSSPRSPSPARESLREWRTKFEELQAEMGALRAQHPARQEFDQLVGKALAKLDEHDAQFEKLGSHPLATEDLRQSTSETRARLDDHDVQLRQLLSVVAELKSELHARLDGQIVESESGRS